jgi:hypothetical protein
MFEASTFKIQGLLLPDLGQRIAKDNLFDRSNKFFRQGIQLFLTSVACSNQVQLCLVKNLSSSNIDEQSRTR